MMVKKSVRTVAGAVIALAVVGVNGAYALDLPEAGETYTVPANTTNEVTEADIEAYNALGKVVFADETSALRFTSATAPNVLLEGAGWMIKDNDATWEITCQQTDAWYGKWDFKAGKTTPKDSQHGLFYYYGTKGLYDLYIREGAEVSVNSAWRNVCALCRIHLAGRLTLSGSGSTVQLCQLEIEGPNAEVALSGTTPMYFYNYTRGTPNPQKCGINLNGYYLPITIGGSYDSSVLQFCHGDRADLTGPGAIYMDRRTGGIRVENYNTQNFLDGTLGISGGLVVTANVQIASRGSFGADGTSGTGYGVLRQKDSTVVLNRIGLFGGNNGGRPAYLLESGIFDARTCDLIFNGGTNTAGSAYLHFRQTGGDFSANRLSITNSNAAVISADFAFGGSGTAAIGAGGLQILGAAAFSFNDSVAFSLAGGIGNLGGSHVWAFNGGAAEMRFLDDGTFTPPEGDFFAFDGGSAAYGASSDGTTAALFGSSPEIRVYEGGGGIAVNSSSKVDIDGVDFTGPSGNVLKSIAISSELASVRFRTPPSVEITDATGTGAAAVVDYDFDTKKVTNITVVCKGENYTAPTANLRFRSGEALLSTPLACTVGPEESGDFTFSATNLGAKIQIKASTNYCSSLVVDMDRLGLADGGKDTKFDGNALVLYFKNKDLPVPAFPNLTNITVKSGMIGISSSYGYKHDNGFLPKCYSLQLYGGHLSGGACTMSNVVVGGTVYLTGHDIQSSRSWAIDGGASPYHSDINLTTGTFSGWTGTSVPALPGTMVVDVDSPNGPAVLKGGTGQFSYSGNPSIYRGNVRFGGSESNPSTMTVKNCESLKTTRSRRVLLDLSDSNLGVWGTNNVAAVTPPDLADFGQLKWSAVERKLYWVPGGGMFLIFR